MALTRELFDELDVPNLLAGSLNDDLRLSKAARATGRKIAFVRSLILPTPIDFTWGTFFEFVRRQYTQVKFFSPILYTGVNFVLGFYVLGAATIVAALVYGYFYAWIPVAAAYVIDQFRALARQQVYLSLFKENGIRQKLFAAGWLEHMLTPFWMTLHWILLASTWTQNRLTWAGVRYQIYSKSKTRVLHRSATATPLPVGAPGLAMLSALNDLRRGAMTQPIRPVAAPTAPLEPVATYTAPETIETAEVVATEAAPEIVATVLPAATEVAAGVEVEAAIYSACEEAPSAILPLTVSFHERTERQRVRASDRGALGAAEFILGKTRALPHRLHATPAPVVAKEMAAASPTTESTMAPFATKRGRVLTAVERALDKTRLHQAGARRPPSIPSPLSRPQPPTRLDRVLSRTRPSLIATPAVAAVSPPAAAPQAKPSSRSQAPRSLAGRRAPLGANLAAFAPGRGVAARSLRTLSSGRTGCHPIARPVPPGASARP
jgi:hypothetical protein